MIKSSKRTREKRKRTVEKDTEFYQEIWDENPHYCEECGRFLGDEPNREFFSHILTKGAHPALRRIKLNVNVLCHSHHSEWEFGRRNRMRIYESNKVRIQELYKIEREM